VLKSCSVIDGHCKIENGEIPQPLPKPFEHRGEEIEKLRIVLSEAHVGTSVDKTKGSVDR
jgi:hypothetical protein